MQKKPKAKKLGAKKLETGNSTDVRIDSFEVVEKRALKAQQEEEDRKLAVKIQSQESAGESTGRVAALALAEAGADGSPKKSIYRNDDAQWPARSGSDYGRAAGGVVGGGNNGSRGGAYSSSSYSSSAGAETYAAREKYGSQKGISSDQYFGRDEEDAAAARSRLHQLSGSSAISSDMIYGGGGGGGGQAGGNDDSLAKLKESVAGFFDDIQKRMG